MAKINFEEFAAKVVELVGGVENLSFVTHCATRLRLNVKDDSKVDQDGLKKVNGVLGLEMKNGQCQIIVGQIIEDVYLAVSKLVGDKAGGIVPDDEGTAADIMGYARYAEKNTEQNEAENDTENVRDPELSIAGKTGSAQSVMSGRKVVHGWFSGFCPAEEPEYVIMIFMEDGGGSASCLPAAARLASFLSGLP